MNAETISHEVIIIGGGQAGLATGYYLKQQGRDFVILDASRRVGDVWRNRWDSLRLFTPARYDGLPGMPFPAPANTFPTKDAMANYLEAYATQFALPVQLATRVEHLASRNGHFVVTAGQTRYEAQQVVVAMANLQQPRVPAFAATLAPRIKQLHSSEYRNPAQLQAGGVLIVGAGNSGAEIGLELARGQPTWLAGRDTGHVPFRIEGVASRLILSRLVLRGIFHRVLTTSTPIGRRARPGMLSKGGPLIRVKPKDLAAAGIKRVPRMVGVRDGMPLLEDGVVLDVANVIWCTGFQPGFTWIDLPVQAGGGPIHERGVVASQPGLYFVGLHFLYALSSVMIHGVARDAEHIAQMIQHQARQSTDAEQQQPDGYQRQAPQRINQGR